MSALTDLFTAFANKIRSKTGGSDTYTPPEMVDAIDDVYDAGLAAGETTHTQTYTPATNTAANDMGVTHEYRYVNTSGMITPSGNKAITANGTNIDVTNYATASVAVPDPTLTGDADVGNVLSGKTFYKDSLTKKTGAMTNNGAILQALNCGDSYTVPEGYHNGNGTVTANSLASQTGVDSGKTAIDASHVFNGYQGWVNGSKISGTYTAPTIQSITPSDSSPVALATSGNYNPSTSGYAIKNSPSNLTPSSSAPSISNGTIYKAGGGGYAIDNYTSISQAQLQNGVYFSSGFKKMASSGYAYSTQQKRTASGSVALSTSTSTKVTTGFRPKYVMAYSSSNPSQGLCYNEDVSTTQFRCFNSTGNANYNLGGSTNNFLYSINDDGFTINKASSARTYYWFASE